MEKHDHLYDANDHLVSQEVHKAIRRIITQVIEKKSGRPSTHALLAFVLRNAGSWESLRTLISSCSNMEQVQAIERMNAILLDCGAIVRCMYDAYLQAVYVWQNPDSRDERGTLYLQYRFIERYKMVTDGLSLGDALSRHLAGSPRRAQSEKAMLQDYDRVKDRYPKPKGRGVRNHWYPHEDLRKLAKDIGKESEYVWMVKTLNGAVHTGPWAMTEGPILPGARTLSIAEGVLAHTAKMLMENEELVLDGPSQALLDAYKSDFVSVPTSQNEKPG